MAKEHEFTERVERVEEIIKQLESGDPSREEGERLFEESQQTIDEIQEILALAPVEDLPDLVERLLTFLEKSFALLS